MTEKKPLSRLLNTAASSLLGAAVAMTSVAQAASPGTVGNALQIPPAGKAWLDNAAPLSPSVTCSGKPKIMIVIDDVTSRTVDSVLNIPAQITLAFLPDGSSQADFDKARHAGNDAIIHMPVEPKNWRERKIGLEPSTLMTGAPMEQNRAKLTAALDKFKGYIGINNHMGSAGTEDPKLMAMTMEELARRNLSFLDSKTSQMKVAIDAANAARLPNIARDVFLDHEIGVQHSLQKLDETAARARQTGMAVAIGHPHGATLQALTQWVGRPDIQNAYDFVGISYGLKAGQALLPQPLPQTASSAGCTPALK